MSPVSLNTDPEISNKPDRNQESTKVNINNQMVYTNRYMVYIYVPIFNTGSAEARFKFLVILNKILKGKRLNTGIQYYVMVNNILTRGTFQVLKKNQYNSNITTDN